MRHSFSMSLNAGDAESVLNGAIETFCTVHVRYYVARVSAATIARRDTTRVRRARTSIS